MDAHTFALQSLPTEIKEMLSAFSINLCNSGVQRGYYFIIKTVSQVRCYSLDMSEANLVIGVQFLFNDQVRFFW